MSYDEASFLAGLTTGVSIHGWACVKMNDGESAYVISEPVEFTLLADKWSGTTYILSITDYSVAEWVQIGLPAVSTAPNTQAVIKAALTIPQVVAGETSGTIYISSVQRPSEDLKIAIFGLTPVENVNE